MTHSESASPEQLNGGLNEVVRHGTTVRRPLAPWSPAVHELLRHLETSGFHGSPRFLGIDDQRREILSLVPGATPWPPSAGLTDIQLVASAARLLRTYHDTVADWTPPTNTWQTPPVPTGPPEVICHNDTAPWNLIATDGIVTAFVDWDTAAPGPRMWDLAYLAYTLIPLAAPENLGPMGWPAAVRDSRADRMKALRDGYGCTTVQWVELLATVTVRISAAYDTMRIWAAENRPGWRAQWNQPAPWDHGNGYSATSNTCAPTPTPSESDAAQIAISSR